MMKRLLPLFALFLFTATAHAEEAKEEKPAVEKAEAAKADEQKPADSAKDPTDKSYRFAPDFCDFEITFPETPSSAQKCVPDGGCYDLKSYTMVYDLSTTVDVSVTCNPSTPAAYDKYNDAVMKAALAGMIDNRNLTEHDIQFKQYDTTKSAALTGTGKTGRTDKIYSAQLWIGKNSVFTVQAELIGNAHEIADKSFRDILQSIKTKEGKQLPKPKEYKAKSNQ